MAPISYQNVHPVVLPQFANSRAILSENFLKTILAFEIWFFYFYQMLSKNRLSYSNILRDFISPYITNLETTESLIAKAMLGGIAWNVAVLTEAKLPINIDLNRAISDISNNFPEAWSAFDKLVARKNSHFSEHKIFMERVEVRDEESGIAVIRVESRNVNTL